MLRERQLLQIITELKGILHKEMTGKRLGE